MFIVEPLAAESTIRSPLGFMSLSTKWGNILFPGVTVLTTNFVQLSLLLHEYKKLKDEKKSNNSIKDILKSENTHRRLEKEWRRIRKEDDLVKTRMTYWNRYGSMFNYFQLDKNYKKLIRKTPIATAARLYKVVFQKNDTYSEKRKDARNRRIQHARRYSKIENWIQKSIDEKNYRALQWWVVGANHVEFADLPDLQLVRQLEFALSIWQTYFELCVSSYPQFRCLPLKPKKIKLAALVEKLILRDKQVATDESTKITKAESIENYDLARELLYIHQTYLKKKMPKWQKLVRKKYPTSADLVLL